MESMENEEDSQITEQGEPQTSNDTTDKEDEEDEGETEGGDVINLSIAQRVSTRRQRRHQKEGGTHNREDDTISA